MASKSQSPPRLMTPGRLATLLGVMPNQIRLAASRIGISPALILNDLPHFNELDVDAIRAELARDKRATEEPAGK